MTESDSEAGRGLRQCVLAVAVLADLDILPGPAGVWVGATQVPWADLAATVGDADPLSVAARRRVDRLLRLHRALGSHPDPARRVMDRARLVALPDDHVDDPGPGWRQARVLGGALQLGLGVLGLAQDPDEVLPLPGPVARAYALDLEATWARVSTHVEEMGALAVLRLDRDQRRGPAVLRPVGGCDVLALLAARTLRTWLADGDGSGLRAVAAPMRTRGWYDLAHVDPAFVGAAWSATDEPERGVAVPLLVTADEVALARTPDAPVRAPRRPW